MGFYGVSIGVLQFIYIYIHIGGFYMGGCQNYGPFLGTLKIRCVTILGYIGGLYMGSLEVL